MRNPKTSRRVIAILNDIHCGSRFGLLNPDTVLLDDMGELWSPELTENQRGLWSMYQKHLRRAREIIGDDELLLFLPGDLTQGLKHWAGVWGTSMHEHIVSAVDCLAPWFDGFNLSKCRILFGTEAHSGEGWTSEHLVARELNQRYGGTKAMAHGKFDIDGVIVDVAHHGPGGGIRKWTDGNVARYTLKSLVMEEIVNGDPPPRVVIRAHHHRFIWETVRIESKLGRTTADLLVVPGYCGINPHARKITRSTITQTHGLVLLDIVDGELGGIHDLTETLDLRATEVL